MTAQTAVMLLSARAVAVMTAEPPSTAVTRPVCGLTLAISSLLEEKTTFGFWAPEGVTVAARVRGG